MGDNEVPSQVGDVGEVAQIVRDLRGFRGVQITGGDVSAGGCKGAGDGARDFANDQDPRRS
eukprot:3039979-Prymnesium_polylepis.1